MGKTGKDKGPGRDKDRPRSRPGPATKVKKAKAEEEEQEEDWDDRVMDGILNVMGAFPKKVARLEWVHMPEKDRYLKFFYDKRGFFICLLASLITYLITSGQPMVMRKVLAVFVFAAGCWMLEVFPISITGLMIPIALTLLGVFSPPAAFAPFAHPVIFLLIGGLVLGQSIRKHELDKRLAYAMLRYSKGKIDRLVLLVILATAFLSMWMSNTVAVAILLPVILTVLSAIPEVYVNLKRKMLLGLTMASTVGGMAMLTGSTPNMIAAASLEAEGGFGFTQWAYYGIPVVLVSLFAIFYILKVRYPSPDVTLNLGDILDQEKVMGPLSNKQKRVIEVFTFTILLWFFGSQAEVWLGLPASISSAAIVSILSVLMMFGLGLLDMQDVKSVQWEIMFLVGGGILLGEAMIISGTASEIGAFFASTQSFLPIIIILLLFIFLALVMTNFISNSATAAILVPIGIELGRALDMSPVPFVMGVGLVASVAFLTPVGTPSTAMVYATGRVPREFLVKNGVLVGVVVALIVLVAAWFMPVP